MSSIVCLIHWTKTTLKAIFIVHSFTFTIRWQNMIDKNVKVCNSSFIDFFFRSFVFAMNKSMTANGDKVRERRKKTAASENHSTVIRILCASTIINMRSMHYNSLLSHFSFTQSSRHSFLCEILFSALFFGLFIVVALTSDFMFWPTFIFYVGKVSEQYFTCANSALLWTNAHWFYFHPLEVKWDNSLIDSTVLKSSINGQIQNVRMKRIE